MTKPTVIILVGGKSSRFSIIGKNDKNFTPKSLSLINGKSILMNIIEHFLKYGFRKFVIPLGHYKEDFIHKITKEAGNKIKLNFYNKSIDIKDNSPEIFLLKTLKNDNKAERVYKCLKKLGDKDIIVSYGDALGNINLNKMNKIFIQSKKKCLIAGYYIASQYGHLKKERNRILFEEKPILENPISIGYFFIKKEILRYFKTDRKKDLEKGIIKKLTEMNEVQIYIHSGFWKSVDTYREYTDLKKLYEK